MLNECLKLAVGLSEKTCECVDDAPNGANTSWSGYYLDDSEHGVPLQFANASVDCGDGGLWPMLEKARKDGINEFLTDFAATLRTGFKNRFRRWTGQIGEKKNNTPILDSIGDYSVVCINPYKISGSEMVLREFVLYFYTANNPNKEVEIYSSEDLTTPVETVQVTVQAQQLSTKVITDAIRLPLSDKHGQPIYYFFVCDRGGDQPYNMKFWCGCTGQRRNWMNFIDPRGKTISNISELENIEPFTGHSEYNYGLGFTADIDCSGLPFLCAGKTEFEREPFYRVVAKSIQLYSTNKLISEILDSGRVNRYTIMEGEKLTWKRSKNKKEIEGRIAWLVENLPDDATDCYVCSAKRPIVKATINV